MILKIKNRPDINKKKAIIHNVENNIKKKRSLFIKYI